MKRHAHALVRSNLALLLLAACSTESSQPVSPKLSPQHSRRSSSSAPGDTLNVSLTGLTLVRRSGDQTYHATVQNPSAATLHYTWFVTDCASNCATASMVWYAEGDGMSSLVVPYTSTNDEKIITVHVNENIEGGRSGAQHLEAGGPNTFATGEPIVQNLCDSYADVYFPLGGPYPWFEQGAADRGFRRNYCDNSVTWAP